MKHTLMLFIFSSESRRKQKLCLEDLLNQKEDEIFLLKPINEEIGKLVIIN